MPIKILKNPTSLPTADAVVMPVYPENTGLFEYKAGRASLVKKPATGSCEIQVTCPETFHEEALRRGYASCIRLAREEKWHSLILPLLMPKEPGDYHKIALHLAIGALRDAIEAEPIQVYLVVWEPEKLGMAPSLRQKLTQYIQRGQQVVAKRSAVVFAEDCASKCSDAAPRPAPSKMMAAPMPAALSMGAMRPRAAKKSKLEDLVGQVDAGFSETLLRLIDKSGKKDSEIYNKANVSRQHFSKIRNHPDYRPTKPTAIAFAIALELDLQQTKDLIGRAGYALTRSSVFDLIIMYFIENKNYNLYEINEALFEFDQNLLGA